MSTSSGLQLTALGDARRVAGVLRNHKRSAALLGVLLVAGGIFQGFGLALIAPLITFMLGSGSERLLARLAAFGIALDARTATLVLASGLVIMVALGHALSVWRVHVTTRLNYILVRDWQKAILSNLLEEDLVESRSSRLGARIQSLLHHPLHAAKCVRRHIDLAYQVTNLVVLCAVLLLNSPMLTVLVFGTLLLANMLFVRPLRRSAIRDAHALRPVFDDLSGYAAEQLMGLTQIRLYGAQEASWKGWARRLAEYTRLHRHQAVREELAAAILPVTISVLMLLLLAYVLLGAAMDVTAAFATIGLFAVVGSRMQAAFASSQRIAIEIGTLRPSLHLVLDNARARPTAIRDGRTIARVAQRVAFEDVSYAYPGGEGVHGLSFALLRGTVTVLCGPSGSGKSTTVALLAGLIRPQAGRIWIDDVDLAEVLPHAWFRRVSVVMQESPLFAGTIRENIRMGRPEADDAAVVAAAERAAVHETIQRLPDGYDTVVAERGQTLSGGQVQRIALARAFIREPDILILDEATNAVDEDTQSKILDALFDFASRGGIVVVVTHRTEAMRAIGRSIVLESGRMVAEPPLAASALAGA
ncbi:MAG: ABC transporter ATP-binding protein/permease [Xanthobacteraceae bacterium]|nr:ABC transporter ATP-binding protein/permease [Xanthobacteraceae bacterium]